MRRLTLAVVVLVGCGGDDQFTNIDAMLIDASIDAEFDADPQAPTVVSVTPVDDDTAVSTTSSVTVVFSEAIAPSSITATSFRLSDPAGTVAGELDVNGATVSFAPARHLDPDASVSVTITTDVTDLAGNNLAAEFTSSFSTAAGGWTTPALLETATDTQVGVDFDAAMRPGGLGAAAWLETQCVDTTCGVPYNLYVTLYSGGAFGTKELVATEPTNLAGISKPVIAIDATGVPVVAWIQRSGTYASVYASRRTGPATWSTPAPIETEELGHASSIDLSSDSAGNVYAVWEQNDGTNVNAWTNRLSAGSWGTAAKLEGIAGTAFDVGVAAKDDATAIALWSQNSNEYFARYFGGSWGSPSLIAGQSNNAASAKPILRVDSSGGTIAIWSAGIDLWASRYTNAWTTPAIIDGASYGILVPAALATSTNGKATALWSQGPSTDKSLYQAIFDGSVWATSARIEMFSLDSTGGSVAYGTGERTMAVWNQAGTTVGWSAENQPGVGWRTPASILGGHGGVVLYDDQLNVFVNVFTQNDIDFGSLYWNTYE